MRTVLRGGLIGLCLALGPAVQALADNEPPTTLPDNVEPEDRGRVTGAGQTVVDVTVSPVVGTEPVMRVELDGQGRPRVVSEVIGVQVPDLRTVANPNGPDADPNLEGACRGTTIILTVRGQEQVTVTAYRQGLHATLKSIFPDRTLTIDDFPACVNQVTVTTDEFVDGFEALFGQVIQQLPRPELVVQPATAVTGLDTYLQTNRPLTWQIDDATIDLGDLTLPVTMQASGSFVVDWGQQDVGPDRAFDRVTGPHHVPGRAYDPDKGLDQAAITHVYTVVPDQPVSVTVTDTWTFHYTIPGIGSGIVVAELLPVTLPLDVIEYQAVIQN